MRLLPMSLSLAVLLSFPIFGQSSSPATKLDSKSNEFSGEPFVIEQVQSVFSMKADGTGYRERTVAVKIQSEAALRNFGIVSLPFASASEHVEFHYARVRRADGTVAETPTSGALELPEPVTREAPFYSDLKDEQLPIKNLRVGDTLEWQARIVRTKAEAPGEFWGEDTFLTDGSVALKESIELRVPLTSPVTVWTNPKDSAQPTETTAGDQKIYRWEASALKPSVGPRAEAAKKEKKTHTLTAEEEKDAEQGALPSAAWTTFKSWAAVGAWYRGLEGERAQPDDEIKAKVAELTAGKTTQEEKIRAVYGYVSTQIRYIGVAFGIGRYQPHSAVDVLHNQYGDCKDKEMLLSAMLSALGVSSDAALIGAGVRFDEAVPSPASFNHLITHLQVDGKTVWLDSTEEIAPYRMMYAVLRDRPSLVVPPAGEASIERTPSAPPFDSFQRWKATGTMDKNGFSKSHITFESRGDDELILRAALRQISPAQYDEFGEKLMSSIGYSGKTSNSEFSQPEDTAGPVVFNFDYERDRSDDWTNLRFVPQFAPVDLPRIDEKEAPVSHIDLGVPRTETSTATMILPDGWSAELPEAIHAKNAFVTYDTTYRLEKGTVYADRKITILQQKIPATDWKTYVAFQDATSLQSDFYVVLKRPGDRGSNSGNTGSSATQAEEDELLRQLNDAYQRKDAKAMEVLLKQLKKVNPNARRLMAWTASLALVKNKPDEAIADNQKELERYPDELDRYEAIIWIQMRQKDKPGVVETLKAWAAADPTNDKPLVGLAQAQLAADQPLAALSTAQQALSLVKDDSADSKTIKLLIGQAQLKCGKKTEAAATLLPFLDSSDPGTLNDVGYFLADASVEMPKAEAAVRKAVDLLTAETTSWTLDEAPATLLAKSSLLAAAWDSLGWVLFREGKFAEAEPYIVASCMNRSDATVLDHLAKVQAAVAATGKSPMALGFRGTTQESRTTLLGSSLTHDGVAEYRLLLAHNAVQRAQPTGDNSLPGGTQLLLKAQLKNLFPPDSDAQLVRTGMLNCHAGKCELVLEP